MQTTGLRSFPAMFLIVFSADFNCFITTMELLLATVVGNNEKLVHEHNRICSWLY